MTTIVDSTTAETWPHHYGVEDRVDNVLFLAHVRHILRRGYTGRFYNTPHYVFWSRRRRVLDGGTT
jgi:hypothetical protein